MLVNKNSLDALFSNLNATFNKAFESAPSVWARVAMKVTSNTAEENYAWLSKFPKMRKWIGEKHIKQLSAFKYSLVNDDFEATVEVERNNIEDDKLGIYGPQAQMAGASAKELPDELIAELVAAGFESPCYDGQYFFDTDHEVGDASVSNKGTIALSISSLAAAQASYGAARTVLRKMKDEEGRPLNINPDVLLLRPA